MSERRRTIAGTVGAFIVLALSGLWFAAREKGAADAANFRAPSRWMPATWPPALRGAAWLAAGAAAVAFDLFVVRDGAETQRGRDLANAFAIVTGVAFLAFAVASFANAI